MPELPEVETTRRGLEPLLIGRILTGARIHNGSLRWPVPCGLGRSLAGRRVAAVERRSKYLLILLDGGTLIVHLGMTGHLRVASAAEPSP